MEASRLRDEHDALTDWQALIKTSLIYFSVFTPLHFFYEQIYLN